MVTSACTHPSDTNTFTQSHNNTFIASENIEYLNEVFLKLKSFLLSNKKNFNPKIILYIIFNKTVW